MTEKKKKEKRFRLRSKKFFLTYPQLDSEIQNLEEKAVVQFEKIFVKERREFEYLIAKEFHEDGNPHLHVYLSFSFPEGIYSASKLDLEIDGKIYHGNYQVVKSFHSTIQYIIKASESLENVITNIELPIFNNKYFTNIHEHLYEVLMASGIDEAINILYKIYPKQAIQRGSTILNNLALADDFHTAQNRSNSEIVYSLNDFTGIPEKLNEWLEKKPKQTLLLHGPSGTGKTQLAKTLLQSLNIKYVLVREIEGLKKFSAGLHRGIIFDDMDVSSRSREELIHMFDIEQDSDIRILYGTKVIPAYTVKIFTTNNPGQFLRNDKALSRRAITVAITNPVFNSTTNLESESIIHPALKTSSDENYDQGVIIKSKQDDKSAPAKKKDGRGRPKGSKNKKK